MSSTPSATARWLQTSTVPERRGDGGEGTAGLLFQRFADPLKGKAGQVPLAHEQELLDMHLPVAGALANALRAIDEAGLDAAGDGASRQLCGRSDFVEGEGSWGVHGGYPDQLNCIGQLP